MAQLRRFVLRLSNVFRPGHAESDLARELASHLTLLEDDFRRRGMTAEEARLAARRVFGGVEQVKDQHRDARSIPWLDDARKDVRYAVRTLARNAGFASVTVLTLALGIGATTAIFSVVNAVLLRPLPYNNSDRLVRIIEHVPAAEAPRGVPEETTLMNQDEFVRWRARTKTLLYMAVYGTTQMTLTTPERTVRLNGARVSPALFPMLGAQPRLGRVLTAADERLNADVVVLSAAAWHRYFASDVSVIGRTIMLDAKQYSIVGVTQSDFDVPTAQTEFWAPYAIATPQAGRTTFVHILARLQDGLSIDAATAEANAIGREFRNDVHASLSAPTSSPGQRFEIRRMRDQLVAPVRPALRVLVVSVGVLLLIVCANVATLMLARGTTRQREIGIRRALGAGRLRIVRQVLMETVVLSVIGGVTGVALAYVGIHLLKALAVVDTPELFQLAEYARSGTSLILPRIDEVGIDTGVLMFACGVSLLTGLLFGLAPAVQTSRLDVVHAIGNCAGSAAALVVPYGRTSIRNVLVVGQLVLATTLLVGASLLIHSFVKLSNVHTGYDPANVLTFQLVPPHAYAVSRKAELADTFASHLRALPRVDAAGFTSLPPLAGGVLAFGVFVPPGGTLQAMLRDPRQPQARSVSRDYLRALGVRMVEGRWFHESDRAEQPLVLLVNRALARRYFGDGSPLGAQVHLVAFGSHIPWHIVGVVDDVRQGSLDEEPYPQFFVDPRQALVAIPSMPDRMREGVALGFLSFAVRVNGEPATVVPNVRALLRQLDPAAALDGVTTMDHLLSGSLARPRLYVVLMTIFASVAGVLGVIGIYGVLAYAVSERTREIGIRMALGAQPGEVLSLVLRQASFLTAIGIAIGVVSAMALSRNLAGMLFGVTPVDPPTYVIVAVGFASVAMLASYMPARRATKVDPLLALRYE